MEKQDSSIHISKLAERMKKTQPESALHRKFSEISNSAITIGQVEKKSPDSGVKLAGTEKKANNVAIPKCAIEPEKIPTPVMATPVPMEEPELLVREEDCPAIGVCAYVDNVRGCCCKGESINIDPTPCIQGLLLLVAKVHNVPISAESEREE